MSDGPRSILIRGKPAVELFNYAEWWSTYYECEGRIYLRSSWNHSAAYYEVLIELPPAESARCRAEGAPYMQALARLATNNARFEAHLVRDFKF